MPTPHPIYSKAAGVYLETAGDKLTALQQAINNSGFPGERRGGLRGRRQDTGRVLDRG